MGVGGVPGLRERKTPMILVPFDVDSVDWLKSLDLILQVEVLFVHSGAVK